MPIFTSLGSAQGLHAQQIGAVSNLPTLALSRMWFQTLLPPPFTGPMRRLAAGLDVGDDELETIDTRTVKRACARPELLQQSEEPSWVDWDKVVTVAHSRVM